MIRKRWLYAGTVTLAILSVVFFGLGLHRKPRYIQNFEAEEYGREQPFLEPASVAEGLAVYSAGSGDPVLVFPYPHGHTTEPMAQGPIAEIVTGLGRRVITYDVPGAYRSTRKPVGDMAEMIRAADETLDRLGIRGSVDVVGHSMGGFAALAYAVERPARVRRLVLVTSVSGFPAAARCGFPGSAFRITEADYWRVIIWGVRINSGRADLVLHKQLYNLMAGASYYDPAFFSPLAIDADDHEKGVPVRMVWSQNMYSGLSYAERLGDVQAPTLILAGRHDPQASLACSQELFVGIPDGELVVFEKSGHAPFIEEAALFADTVGDFLNGDAGR
jgi:proline iminopeptidase